MANITIDGKEYALEDLSNNAKVMASQINFSNKKIAELKAELLLADTANKAYMQALKAELEK